MAEYWAQVETTSNQAYIFGSNRLRENIGASFLLAQACVDWVREALPGDGSVAEVLVTSGRAVLRSTSRTALVGLINEITWRALTEAPGLTVTGSVCEFPDRPDEGTTRVGTVMRQLAVENDQIAGAHPASTVRFLRLPPVASCAVSEFPAERTWRDGVGGTTSSDVSEVSYRKRRAGGDGLRNLRHTFNTTADSLEELEDAARLGSDIGWTAVVHIDGNAVGRTFIDLGPRCFEEASGNLQAADDLHLKALAHLSTGLMNATEKAVKAGVTAVGDFTIIPLVVGGDDVTVVCTGATALSFTRSYIEDFERSTEETAEFLRTLLPSAGIPPYYTACAGVAIVKPHFPFFVAYELAEALISSAKARAKRAHCGGVVPSAFDVHLLSDSRSIDLESIRARRRSADGDVELWGGPYLVGRTSCESDLRTLDWLNTAMAALRETNEDGRRSFARSAASRVKQGLFISAARANEVAAQNTRLLPADLLESGSVVTRSSDRCSSALVDVIDLVDIDDDSGAPTLSGTEVES
jgi:hypothetical protein